MNVVRHGSGWRLLAVSTVRQSVARALEHPIEAGRRKQNVALAVGGNLGPTVVRLEDAFCAPVFDSAGHLALGITAMGPAATFDSDWNGKVAKPLHACALEVSRSLGYLEAAWKQQPEVGSAELAQTVWCLEPESNRHALLRGGGF